jgi:hypothetical protein
MKDRFIRTCLLAGVLATASLVACGGGGSSTPAPLPPPTPAAKLGTLSIAVTNKQVCGFEAVNATYAKFRVSQSTNRAEANDPSWVDVPVSPARKINLVNLTNGALETVAQASLEAGHYTQFALVLDTGSTANTIVPAAGDSEQALEVPGAFAGRFLDGGFDVVEGQKTNIVLDVDACRAVYTTPEGKRAIAPYFYPVPSAPNGIKGFVTPGALANHVLVTAQQYDGWIAASVRPDPATGEFWLSHLEPGNYDVVVTADNSAASMVGRVPVEATAAKAISTRESPVPITSSKMGSISGSLSFPYYGPGGSPINVYAVQYCGPSQAGAVRYNLSDGPAYTYTLPNLPRAAPLYAQYTDTLPLAFAACQTSTYRVRTFPSALIDSGGVAGIDISTGDKSGVNIVLIPSGP